MHSKLITGRPAVAYPAGRIDSWPNDSRSIFGAPGRGIPRRNRALHSFRRHLAVEFCAFGRARPLFRSLLSAQAEIFRPTNRPLHFGRDSEFLLRSLAP